MPGFTPAGALWHPTMLTVDEAQRRRFEDESANYERECFIALVYQPPAPHKQRLLDLAMGAGAEHSLNLEQQLLAFERQVSELAGALSGLVGLTSLSDEGDALRLPDRDLTTITLCNMGSINPTELNVHIADLYLNPDFRFPGLIPQEQGHRYKLQNSERESVVPELLRQISAHNSNGVV